MQKKEKSKRLKKPSILRRVWKVWLYNIIWTALFFWLFWGFYTLDDLCYELDYFLMEVEVITDIRKELIAICLAFWFMFRQFMKDLNLIKYTYKAYKHDKEVVKIGGHKRIYEGPEGNGKTINVANDALLLACDADRRMRLQYYLKYPYKEQLKNDPDYKALVQSFNFYESNPDKIPHLMSNFKFKYKNRENYSFDMDYFDQKKRLAEGFTIAYTEIARDFPNSWGKMPKDEEKDVFRQKIKNDFLSTSRQSVALKIVADEQRTGEVWLGFRSVTSNNRRIDKSKKVLNPHFLTFLLNRLEKKVLKKKKKTKRFHAVFHRVLSTLIEDIGFYVFEYSDKEAIQDNGKSEGNIFVISCDLPYDYDTRGERFKYPLYAKAPDALA